ncbi:MAG: DNA repair protein RadC [Nitrospirae bacterium]|nr:DNA repair protein RadC [Nitrospirota bacterium]
MAYKSIKNWPEEERPRERLLKLGVESLSNAQLLAIILRIGGGGKSAIDLAMEMLDSFKNLKDMDSASIKEFTALKGMGVAKASQVKAAFELGRRLFREPDKKGPVFSSSMDVYSYYHPVVKDMKKEVLFCAMLDAKNRIFRDCRISEGTLTNSFIHPREAFSNAIRESAAAVIFIHNHPSGDPTPSREDISITERLIHTGEIIGIKVLDHVIIGNSKHISIMDGGYIKQNQNAKSKSVSD